MAKRETGPAGDPNYIAHGSDKHAALLGLKEAEEHDVPQHEGWALQDVTQYGASARPEFLEQVLRQKVNELTTPFAQVQSDDPRAPNYAPPLWQPG